MCFLENSPKVPVAKVFPKLIEPWKLFVQGTSSKVSRGKGISLADSEPSLSPWPHTEQQLQGCGFYLGQPQKRAGLGSL